MKNGLYIYKGNKITASSKEEAIKKIVASPEQLWRVEYKYKSGDIHKDFFKSFKKANNFFESISYDENEGELEDYDYEWVDTPVKDINVDTARILISSFNKVAKKINKYINANLQKVSNFDIDKWNYDELVEFTYWEDDYSPAMLSQDFSDKKLALIYPIESEIDKEQEKALTDIGKTVRLSIAYVKNCRVRNNDIIDNALYITRK